MTEALTLYLPNLAIMLAVMCLLWPISVWRNDPSFIDSVWPLGFIVMAVSSAVLSGQSVLGGSPIFYLVLLWGLRLSAHLFSRWLREGMDRRYKAIRERATTMNVHLFTLLYVFGMQAILLWLVSLPIQHAMAAGPIIAGPALWIALVLFTVGFLFETIGDWQLTRFKADPDNAGKVMDRGLWRFTRHPNYFGDACVFWAFWLVAVSAGSGWWTLVGPVFLTWTLAKWSGAALLEKGLHQTRPDYADYVARTPGFVPGWVKRD
jgi:steroid 5-alpha reductase family enzyme